MSCSSKSVTQISTTTTGEFHNHPDASQADQTGAEIKASLHLVQPSPSIPLLRAQMSGQPLLLHCLSPHSSIPTRPTPHSPLHNNPQIPLYQTRHIPLNSSITPRVCTELPTQPDKSHSPPPYPLSLARTAPADGETI